MTKQDAFEIFRNVAAQVWKNADFALGVTTLDEATLPPHDYVAALVHSQRGAQAFGDVIFRRPASYRLRVAERLLALPHATVRDVMVHEAVHLGHPNHGREFRDLCRKHGGTVSEAAQDRGGNFVVVEMKVGSRFRPIKTFDDEDAARSFMRAEFAAHPGRYRMSM